jgi:hypothetical protein
MSDKLIGFGVTISRLDGVRYSNRTFRSGVGNKEWGWKERTREEHLTINREIVTSIYHNPWYRIMRMPGHHG